MDPVYTSNPQAIQQNAVQALQPPINPLDLPDINPNQNMMPMYPLSKTCPGGGQPSLIDGMCPGAPGSVYVSEQNPSSGPTQAYTGPSGIPGQPGSVYNSATQPPGAGGPGAAGATCPNKPMDCYSKCRASDEAKGKQCAELNKQHAARMKAMGCNVVCTMPALGKTCTRRKKKSKKTCGR